jgi:hypothetical protein
MLWQQRVWGERTVSNFLLLFMLAGAIGFKPMLVADRQTVVLDGKVAEVAIDLGGGSIVRFRLKQLDLNPIVWGNDSDSVEPRAMGHFVCLDRWGAPSDQEAKNGMYFHGEATNVHWTLDSAPARRNGGIEATMSAKLPIAGLSICRRIRLEENAPAFVVTESVANNNRLGRLFNIVQHPTIGPPFLDESVVVDSNARKGFMQSSPMPNPEEPAVFWPQALKDGQPVNLRHLTDDPAPNVVSYVIDEEYGWTTATNAGKGLLIGYFWRTSEHPWLNMWRHVADRRPLARGLEFGTTGLHQPFAVLVRKSEIFGRPIFSYLDAGERVTKSYAAFLATIPTDYGGVDRINYDNGVLSITERGDGPRRQLSIPLASLQLEL